MATLVLLFMDIRPSTFLVFPSSSMTCVERFFGHPIFKWLDSY